MKLLSAQQIHQWDAFTIMHEPVASIDLMERAAQSCTDWIIENNLHSKTIRIFCGKGNNGGDGLAIARQLIERGVNPSVFILEFGAKGTDDFQTNLNRLHPLTTEIYFLQSEDFFPEIQKEDLTIDALFGSGLNRPLTGLSASLVDHINNSGAEVIAIDVPSGMFIDKSSLGNRLIKATYTLTFQSLKLNFLLAENAVWFGYVEVLDIRLHHAFLQEIDADFNLLDKHFISRHLIDRKPFSHKGTFGHALLVAGNKGKMGAAVLAARSCLRTGVGLLTTFIPEEALSIMQTAVPEAMVLVRGENPDLDKYNTLGIGPGLGTADDAVSLLKTMLEKYSQPVVLDADALNIISGNKQLLKQVPQGSVLTPHPKEFDRLFGESPNDFERLQKAIDASKEYPLIIILKGHYSLVAHNGKGWFNTTGNAGMATGGTGDVLTGIITSLLAQKYTPFIAACIGVYVHGMAGDLALAYQSEESLLPSDIIEALGTAFNQLRS
ncbi:NAD(P)H-hydrate dehydratase [Danxiaibacter flavus]|uniref:Bifunctional NAD(P)H-hydrate repair enzyme n=1 Tax=Danxiaibacter flavus TaxID=3049108 RepID=A0ABV3ZEL3_9BACT|nr:NAD(P)H-hydrate dehydratase [Chitinophagaceae bacterium DXS]